MLAVVRTYLRDCVCAIGRAGIITWKSLCYVLAKRLDLAETLTHIDKAGIGSLPIVAVSASFIGMALSVQFAREIVTRFGADFLVGGFVSMAMFRELAPVFVAVVMSGNIGAAMTAELGTMKVTHQIDALRVFKIDVLEYLVVPRVIGTAIAGPALAILGTLVSLLSGQLFTEFLVGVPGQVYWESVQFTTRGEDVVAMLTKSLVYSVAIAVIAAGNGLSVSGSSEDVGRQTTRTVVWCLLAIFILNYFLTSLFFRF